MKTKKLEDVQKKLKQQYFENTHNDVDEYKAYYFNFLDALEKDIWHFIFETIREHDEQMYGYFFNWESIEDLINLYFKEKKLTFNDIKKILNKLYKVASKHINTFSHFDFYLAKNVSEMIAKDIINLLK